LSQHQEVATKPQHHHNTSSCLVVGQDRCSPHTEHSLLNGNGGRGQQVLLTLSQLNGNSAAGGLVILNSKTKSFESPSAIMPYIRLSSPHIKSPSPELEQDVAAATRGDLGSVSAAVNTLNNIQDFGLHHLQGSEFESSAYPGVQPVTDSLLSGSESQKSDDSSSIKSEADNCSGRLLDFKSAFSDLESKPDMSFLDLSQDDLHRTLSANIPLTSDQHAKVNGGGSGGYYRHNQRHNPMIGSDGTFGSDSHLFYHNPSFDLNLDSFDILSEFPDSTPHSYDGGIAESGQHGAGSPMNNNAASHVGATIKTRTLEYRENLVTITDYSPSWPYNDVSILYIFSTPTLKSIYI
jgi:hypothetical protein